MDCKGGALKIRRTPDAAVVRAVEWGVLAGLLGGLEVAFEFAHALRDGLELFGVELLRLAREFERALRAACGGGERACAQTLLVDGARDLVAGGDDVRLLLAD